ncbi:MAG TPA: Fe-S oxidoreductase, partial [Chryseolinea sp.]
MLQQIAFAITLIVASYFIRKRVLEIRANINLGKDNKISDSPGQRFRNMILVAFGQKKMFKRIVPAILHLFIYIGFLVINLEVLEFIIDGLAGTHRIFAPFLGDFYNVLMNVFEFLAIAVLLACVVMLFRRNVLKLKRFWSAEMTSWPRLDANIILITEIALMCAILTMNAADQILQERETAYTLTGDLFFSGIVKPAFDDLNSMSLVM